MAGGGRVGGQGGPVKRVVWLFIVACVVVAVWHSFPHDPAGFKTELQHKTQQLSDVGTRFGNWVEGVVGDTFPGGSSGDTPASTSPQPAAHPQGAKKN